MRTNNFRKLMRKFERDLLKFIRKAWKIHKSEKDLTKEINDFVKKYKIEDRFKEQFSKEAPGIRSAALKEIGKEIKWLKKHTFSRQYQDDLFERFLKKTKDFARIGSEIRKDVIQKVRAGYKKELSTLDLGKTIKSLMAKYKGNAYAVGNTARQAFSSFVYQEAAQYAGVKKYKYTGTPSLREFCAEHLGKIYTAEEISNLNNGQGLPVWEYRGGYNCSHRWRAVISNDDFSSSETFENGGFLAIQKAANPNQEQSLKARELAQAGNGVAVVKGKSKTQISLNGQILEGS